MEKQQLNLKSNNANKLIINRCFFGKDNCLKIMLNSRKECYMHLGIKNNEKYAWHKIKFQDIELAQIHDVLEGKSQQIAFYHIFNENKRQIWINRASDGESVFFKIKEMTKSLNKGEIIVMKMLIAYIIVRMNLA